MPYNYKRGKETPKSIAFMMQYKIGHAVEVKKGKRIMIDGSPFIVKSIHSVGILGKNVKVIGKCTPLEEVTT
ncbi:hypothetical protein [Jeotgalibacillus proteolyticus]|uniref:Uncharacterized protein n=1 Tax=Jeotgalibacillus proteolyticus TaxID=2082395 RepID=A0A2S5GAZ1_9BACL|nr:hypothetical protein [Jeotgalibacillus proteolyticus]PPA70063.1 hypothetical protein C4B60_10750 [Jeotgalibacillus proteolyticus]